ncbi:MAG: Ppx/GppA family phosphatase [Proteobacteria bacterium]|nr:Ppx/GppA family phosphatase [Pseudomonadota bacterium]
MKDQAPAWRGAAAPALQGAAPVYGALDLGTNNCRLLVARGRGSAGLHVIDAFSRIVRLGEGLGLTGGLSAPAIERTIAALKICAAKLRKHQPCIARVVATEACRRANNGEAFLDQVTRETGLTIEVIGPGEEALLAVAGCSALLDPARRQAIMFDIGGGSTELMWLELPALGASAADGGASIVLKAWMSVPAGVVNLSERFGAAAVTAAGYGAMRDSVASLLAGFDASHGIAAAVAAGGVQMLGSSGTVTTLAGIHLGLPRYDRSRVDGVTVTYRDMCAVSRRIVEMDVAGRLAHPCIGRSRADLVVAGCAILDAILQAWPVDQVRIADRGVREGILLGLMGVPAPIHSPAPTTRQ